MVGITSYGAYIPYHRLTREIIAQAWGTRGKGEKAVAYFDEDSITMAVAATRNCLSGTDFKSTDGLYFASTTSPYREKQSAAIIAAAIDLPRNIVTTDFSGSLRGGATAILAAVNAIKSSEHNSVLVCAADTRLGGPGGAKEIDFGDGAAALLIGDTGVIASIEGTYSIYDEIIDVWRAEKDPFVRSWEDRFVKEKGYLAITMECISAAMKKLGMKPQEITKIAAYAPTGREIMTVAKKLGFDPDKQVEPPLYDSVGNTGSAMAIMSLVAALENAKAGDKLLFVSYGDGCTVLLLKVTEGIEKLGERRGVNTYLERKMSLNNYQKYLRWRDIVLIEASDRPALEQPSSTALWRDRKGGLALYGSECKNCGTRQYPAQRVCVKCRTKDHFEYYSFANKRGKIATYSHDNLAVSLDPPTTICAVDFDEGGRIMCDMTDRDVEKVRIGIPVEMTFRRLRQVNGICDYWWKCTPVRP